MMKQLAIGATLGALLSSACGRAGSSAERAPDVAPRSARTELPPPAESSSPPVAAPDSPPPSEGARTPLSLDALRTYEARSPAIQNRRVGGEPFNELAFDKVVAYDFESDRDSGAGIIEDEKFAARVYKQQALTQEQVDSLLRILTEKATYGGTYAACFEPHLGFVFYQDHEIVGDVSICFACNYLRSTPDIPAVDAHEVRSGEYVFPRFGFSASGGRKLVGVCRELSFSHCELSGVTGDAEH